MRIINIIIIFLLAIFVFTSCQQPTEKQATTKVQRKRVKPANTGYHFENAKEWLKKNNTAAQQNIVLAVNRTDSSNFAKMDSILVPNDISGDVEFYLPFPLTVSYIKDIKKIIFFSYPAQSFAAYEMGELIYAGPTNMGRIRKENDLFKIGRASCRERV